MLHSGGLRICVSVSAFTAVRGVSARGAGGFRHDSGIFVRMIIGKLGNAFFLGKTTFRAAKLHNACSFLRRFFRNLRRAEGMQLGIQSEAAVAAAHRPVSVLVIGHLTGFVSTVTAFRAEMRSPFCAFRTESVFTSQIRCSFRTAIPAVVTVRAHLSTILTFSARITAVRAIGAVFSAVCADIIRAVTAIIAVAAHGVGTVYANAAIGAEFIQTAGALAAIFTDAFRTVDTDSAAVITYLRAAAALTAIFTEYIARTVTADIAGRAEIITAIGAFFPTVRTKIRTVFTALTARTHASAVRAEAAVEAEAVRTGTVGTFAAFNAQLSVGALIAVLTAIGAYSGT